MLVKLNDNIILVGTAHISKDSVREVKEAIEEYKPDVVAVELCKRRYDAIIKKDSWEEKPITFLLKGNNAYFMLAQTFLASIQRKLGKEYGVEPGSEMIAALQEAKKQNVEVALVDRDISVTLKRAWKKMGLREKTRLVYEFIKAIIGYDEEEPEELDLKELMKEDVISALMKEFGEIAPSVVNVLIHERDEYIAKKILDESKKGKILAVVGVGHLKGIKKHLMEDDLDNVSLTELEYVPKKRFSILKAIGYAIPIVFIVVAILLLSLGRVEETVDIVIKWFLINGCLSALGTLIARGHPFSILTAFVAAPLTSLNPAIAAGWVAGWVENKMRKPKIKDFQEISKLDDLKSFWNNKVIRLLMVVAFANLGSVIGTYVAGYYVAEKIFSLNLWPF